MLLRASPNQKLLVQRNPHLVKEMKETNQNQSNLSKSIFLIYYRAWQGTNPIVKASQETAQTVTKFGTVPAPDLARTASAPSALEPKQKQNAPMFANGFTPRPNNFRPPYQMNPAYTEVQQNPYTPSHPAGAIRPQYVSPTISHVNPASDKVGSPMVGGGGYRPPYQPSYGYGQPQMVPGYMQNGYQGYAPQQYYGYTPQGSSQTPSKPMFQLATSKPRTPIKIVNPNSKEEVKLPVNTKPIPAPPAAALGAVQPNLPDSDPVAVVEPVKDKKQVILTNPETGVKTNMSKNEQAAPIRQPSPVRSVEAKHVSPVKAVDDRSKSPTRSVEPTPTSPVKSKEPRSKSPAKPAQPTWPALPTAGVTKASKPVEEMPPTSVAKSVVDKNMESPQPIVVESHIEKVALKVKEEKATSVIPEIVGERPKVILAKKPTVVEPEVEVTSTPTTPELEEGEIDEDIFLPDDVRLLSPEEFAGIKYPDGVVPPHVSEDGRIRYSAEFMLSFQDSVLYKPTGIPPFSKIYIEVDYKRSVNMTRQPSDRNRGRGGGRPPRGGDRTTMSRQNSNNSRGNLPGRRGRNGPPAPVIVKSENAWDAKKLVQNEHDAVLKVYKGKFFLYRYPQQTYFGHIRKTVG
jgi:hypothetical protein